MIPVLFLDTIMFVVVSQWPCVLDSELVTEVFLFTTKTHNMVSEVAYTMVTTQMAPFHSRAGAICSDVTAKDQETWHIRQAIINNGYPSTSTPCYTGSTKTHRWPGSLCLWLSMPGATTTPWTGIMSECWSNNHVCTIGSLSIESIHITSHPHTLNRNDGPPSLQLTILLYLCTCGQASSLFGLANAIDTNRFQNGFETGSTWSITKGGESPQTDRVDFD